MQTQTLTFATQTTDKGTTRIGRGSLYQPRPAFVGGSISWFDDRMLIRKQR